MRIFIIMKRLTEMLLTLAIAVGTVGPAMGAETNNMSMPTGQAVNAQVESVDGSIVVVKTATGETQSFRVEPALISSLKLSSGSNIVIDGTRLRTGKALRLDSYTVEVELDNNGGEKSYILTREARRYLAAGDRVVITPDLRVTRADLYTLTAADLRLQSVMMASSSVVERQEVSETRVQREIKVETAPVAAPTPVTPEPETTAPVSGLW
jgi:hypothetical protein